MCYPGKFMHNDILRPVYAGLFFIESFFIFSFLHGIQVFGWPLPIIKTCICIYHYKIMPTLLYRWALCPVHPCFHVFACTLFLFHFLAICVPFSFQVTYASECTLTACSCTPTLCELGSHLINY